MPRRFPLFQLPNAPLLAAMIAALYAHAAHRPNAARPRLVEHAALLVWAYQEVTAGANWFRRGLGLAGGAVSTFNLATLCLSAIGKRSKAVGRTSC